MFCLLFEGCSHCSVYCLNMFSLFCLLFKGCSHCSACCLNDVLIVLLIVWRMFSCSIDCLKDILMFYLLFGWCYHCFVYCLKDVSIVMPIVWRMLALFYCLNVLILFQGCSFVPAIVCYTPPVQNVKKIAYLYWSSLEMSKVFIHSVCY